MTSLVFDDLGRIKANSKTVELKPYIARAPKQIELMTDQELLAGAGGYQFFDIEVFRNYFLAAFKDWKTKKITKFEIGQGEFNARKLSWLLHNYTCIGFNSIKFDMPLLWLAYLNQDLGTIKDACNDIIFSNMWKNEVEKKYNFTIHNTPHIDLIEVCPLQGSLKLYGGRLHAPRIQELPWGGEDSLEEWQIPITADYCINDLDTTEILFENLFEQLKLREDLGKEYKQDLMSKSDAQIAETVIASELRNITGKWPSKPKIDQKQTFKFIPPSNMFFQTDYMKDTLNFITTVNLSVNENGRLERPEEIKRLRIKLGNSTYKMGIGGLHSSEETVAHKSDENYTLYDRDVASFYPRIVLNCKLFPEHLGEPFLLVYDAIVKRRLAAKEAKRIAESENLKVTINGTFGKTGSPYSILYAPQMTIQITVGGQLYLLMLIEALELNGIQVVSANTDGIVIKCGHTQRELMLDIIKQWEKITGFDTEETEYTAMYSFNVNAYMAICKDGKVKGKNGYYDPWMGKSPKDKYWRFQKNPQAQICVEAIEKLITKQIPYQQTIRECTDITKFVSVTNVKGGAHKNGEYLGKVIRFYYAKGVNGTINNLRANGKVPMSERGKPLMDLPEVFPDDIDYSVYEERTKEMLYDMAYLDRPRQLRFF